MRRSERQIRSEIKSKYKYYTVPVDEKGRSGPWMRFTNKVEAIADARLLHREGWQVAYVFWATNDGEAPATQYDYIFKAGDPK